MYSDWLFLPLNSTNSLPEKGFMIGYHFRGIFIRSLFMGHDEIYDPGLLWFLLQVLPVLR